MRLLVLFRGARHRLPNIVDQMSTAGLLGREGCAELVRRRQRASGFGDRCFVGRVNFYCGVPPEGRRVRGLGLGGCGRCEASKQCSYRATKRKGVGRGRAGKPSPAICIHGGGPPALHLSGKVRKSYPPIDGLARKNRLLLAISASSAAFCRPYLSGKAPASPSPFGRHKGRRIWPEPQQSRRPSRCSRPE